MINVLLRIDHDQNHVISNDSAIYRDGIVEFRFRQRLQSGSYQHTPITHIGDFNANTIITVAIERNTTATLALLPGSTINFVRIG